MTCECIPGPDGHAAFCPERVSLRCVRAVFVDDGWPAGQCQRRLGHDGLCDVYDGRDEAEKRATPWQPRMGVLDFNGRRVL